MAVWQKTQSVSKGTWNRIFTLYIPHTIACSWWTYVMMLPLTVQGWDTEASLECHTRSASGELVSCQFSFMHQGGIRTPTDSHPRKNKTAFSSKSESYGRVELRGHWVQRSVPQTAVWPWMRKEEKCVKWAFESFWSRLRTDHWGSKAFGPFSYIFNRAATDNYSRRIRPLFEVTHV